MDKKFVQEGTRGGGGVFYRCGRLSLRGRLVQNAQERQILTSSDIKRLSLALPAREWSLFWAASSQ